MIPPAVRITRLGVLSAHGVGLVPLVDGIRAGRCPVRPANGIGYPLEPAPAVSQINAADTPPGERACAEQLLGTVEQAFTAESRHLLAEPDCALVVGSGGFLFASGAELYWRWRNPGATADPFHVRGPAWGASLVAEHFGMRGPTLTLSTGCSSSANALLVATEMLQRGHARRALVVGAESVSAVTLSGFDALMLLDPEGCRPFDRDRNGVQLGEAVSVLLLEAGDRNSGRAIMRGGANLCDTHHLTGASPNGAVMRAVMLEALGQASIAPSEIVAIKAHGTGSVDSDRAEAAAINAVFAADTPLVVPVIGLKRFVGHTLGACGALETAALLGCFEAGFLPATAGFGNVDAELGLTPTSANAPARPGCHLLNFFGFGGNYTSLVVEFGRS
ncbi:MAG: beta-ketoacyl synthase N-terminal-like domain-containing protein [Burkholderiales bacterium]